VDRPIFRASGDKPMKSEVVKAWNVMFPHRPLTMEVDNAVLSQCLEFLRSSNWIRRYEFEINKQRGNAYESIFNREMQRYEAIVP
jgi:hypothetical protein